MKEIEKQGFEKPSPIQCQAWPILLSGKDLIGIAQTGTGECWTCILLLFFINIYNNLKNYFALSSGKTLAFLLPALIHIDGQTDNRSERKGPNVLAMAPTRELALQIEKEVAKYEYHGIKS